MNAYSPTDFVDTNMTSKGQVLIPKAMRERAGLTPTERVQVGVNEAGEVVVRARPGEETREQRALRIRAAIEAVAGTVKTGFASTDAYMDHIRPWRNDLL